MFGALARAGTPRVHGRLGSPAVSDPDDFVATELAHLAEAALAGGGGLCSGVVQAGSKQALCLAGDGHRGRELAGSRLVQQVLATGRPTHTADP